MSAVINTSAGPEKLSSMLPDDSNHLDKSPNNVARHPLRWWVYLNLLIMAKRLSAPDIYHLVIFDFENGNSDILMNCSAWTVIGKCLVFFDITFHGVPGNG
jgi:hypothetical protein